MTLPLPTPGGDTGTWGTILNAKIDEVEETAANGLAALQEDLLTEQDRINRVDPGSVPTDPGQTLGTPDGVSIDWIRPGRIDVKARGVSGDGTTDRTAALSPHITEAATNGAELFFGDGTWIASIDAVSNLRIVGTGTIKAPTGLAASKLAVIRRESSAENITIEGVTIDGNAECSGLNIENVTGATIRRCRIVNTGTTTNYGEGVRVVDADHATIEGCVFDDVETAVSGVSAERLKVRYNDVAGCRSNAFSYVAWTTAFPGCQWIGNTGRGIHRMGLEILSGSGGYLLAPVIAHNDLALADNPDHPSDSFGMSVVGADSARLIGNTLTGYIAYADLGIEIGSQASGHGDAILIGNLTSGFATGYAFNSMESLTAAGNISLADHTGFSLITSSTMSLGISVVDNIVRGFRDTGIAIRESSGVAIEGGHIIERNRMFRDRSWSGDDTRDFNFIFLESMGIPVRIVGNRGFWTESSPTAGLDGRGLFIAAGWDALPGSVFDDNIFHSRNSETFDAVSLNAGGNAINDALVNRTFTVDASGALTSASDNRLGFFGKDTTERPAITGSRGSNAALADLLTKLAAMGLITDSTS